MRSGPVRVGRGRFSGAGRASRYSAACTDFTNCGSQT